MTVAGVAAAYEELKRGLRSAWDAPHVAYIGLNGWSLEHPLSCADLQGCPFGEFLGGLTEPPRPPGAYGLTWSDAGGAVFRPYVEETPRAALRRLLLECEVVSE